MQLNREFPNAYQGKFFKEQGIATRYQAPQRADLNPRSQSCPSPRSMSAFGGNADMGWSIVPIISAAFDPNVWSGRALQEDFVEWADVRSCINVSGL